MKVNGIGGAFIYSTDPTKLAAFYQNALGMELESYGDSFFCVFHSADPSGERSFDTTFSIMSWKRNIVDLGPRDDTEGMYGDQPYMINLRVDSMTDTIAHLESVDVPVLGKESFEYGEFAWIRDADGNRVELYESNGAFT